MNIGDRILTQRKIKGLSQGELADAIGVSRQSVSKWESEQSIPDIDKIVLMSDLFGVTTDYLLKGIEKEKDDEAKFRLDPMILVVVASAVSLIAVLYFLSGHAYANEDYFWIITLFVIVAVLYFVLTKVTVNNRKAKKLFLSINIWPFVFIVLQLFCYINSLYRFKMTYEIYFSYPMLDYPDKSGLDGISPFHKDYIVGMKAYESHLFWFWFLWILYFVICLAFVYFVNRKKKEVVKTVVS